MNQSKTVVVPRDVLFTAVTAMRRAEAMLSGLDSLVRGLYVGSSNSDKNTELHRAMVELAKTRGVFEELSMLAPESKP